MDTEILAVPKKWSSPRIPKITPIYINNENINNENLNTKNLNNEKLNNENLNNEDQDNFVRANSRGQDIERRLPPRIIFTGQEFPGEIFLTEIDLNTQNTTPTQIGIKSTGSEKDLIDQQLSELKIVPIKREVQLLTLDSSYRIPTGSLMTPVSQITIIASPQKIRDQNLTRIRSIEKEFDQENVSLIPLPLTAPSLAQSLPVSLPPKVEIVKPENYIISDEELLEYDQTPETSIPYVKPVSVKKNQVYNCVICHESDVGTDDVLQCGHPICDMCISLLPTPSCPFDDTPI